MLYAFFAFKSVWAVLGILAMFIALCLLLFALYGVHRFFQLVQSAEHPYFRAAKKALEVAQNRDLDSQRGCIGYAAV